MLITKLIDNISDPIWKDWIIAESKKEYFLKLDNFVSKEYDKDICYPLKQDIFKLFNLIKPSDIKVIIIGQDPYSTNDMADGIAFSVKNKKISKSLFNIINTIKKNGYFCNQIYQGNLEYLVKQGVFLINTCLTVKKNFPLSHINQGWEIFVKNIIQNIINLNNSISIMLWGGQAKKFADQIKFNKNNLILKTSHPSPLGFFYGFNNTLDFKKCNNFLEEYNIKIIDWGGK